MLLSFGDLETEILSRGSECKLGKWERRYLTKLEEVRAEIQKYRFILGQTEHNNNGKETLNEE